jgi:glutamate/tyrosine decarboxylase-like PLP-dependent enzyme
MKDLIEKIKHLENISQALEPDEISRNKYIDQVMHFGNGFINSLEKVNAYHQASATPNIFEVTSQKKKLDEIIDIYNKEVTEKGINAASGAHLGYIPGGGIFTASLGDLMADISNEYAGMNFASPGGVAIENELINWLKGIFNYPKEAVGNLTSGGSIANLIALTSARDAHQIKGNKIKNSVIYLSDQTHHCIHKALRIIGLEDIITRKISLDSLSRMNSLELKKQIESDITHGLHPFMVIASAGTTDTGAIDPLEEIGKIAAIHDLWYHIDAAYGGFFILSDLKKERFTGIERSDSLVVDPHKGLFLPYGIGAVLVKHKKAVFHSHHQTAHYMQDALTEDSPINPADVSPELTKHFRGMRMWLPLQLHGLTPFIACLEEKIYLIHYSRGLLSEAGFQTGPEPDLSVSYFWYEPLHIDRDLFNKKLLEFIHQDGSAFFSSTRLNGKFVIRIAILSFRTKLKTVDKAVTMVSECLDKAKNHFGITNPEA